MSRDSTDKSIEIVGTKTVYEVKINDAYDRNNIVVGLANAGYKVWIEERKQGVLDKDYFVVYEEVEK